MTRFAHAKNRIRTPHRTECAYVRASAVRLRFGDTRKHTSRPTTVLVSCARVRASASQTYHLVTVRRVVELYRRSESLERHNAIMPSNTRDGTSRPLTSHRRLREPGGRCRNRVKVNVRTPNVCTDSHDGFFPISLWPTNRAMKKKRKKRKNEKWKIIIVAYGLWTFFLRVACSCSIALSRLNAALAFGRSFAPRSACDSYLSSDAIDTNVR